MKTIGRKIRSRLGVSLVLLAALVLCLVAGVANATGMSKGPYLIYPDNNTKMTVLWQLSDALIGDCLLEWGTTAGYGNSENVSTYGDNQYKYTIPDLTPGTKYFYRVEVAGNYHVGTFRTAPAANATNVKFLAYGDTRANGGQIPHEHNNVCSAMVDTYKGDPGYQTFTLLSGDWVNENSEYDWRTMFFNRTLLNALKVQANLPIQGCMGNHEGNMDFSDSVYGKYWPYIPNANPNNDNWYSFDYGPVHVVVINEYRHESWSHRLNSTELGLVEDDLEQSSKQWKFIVLHAPGWSAGPAPSPGGGHPNHGYVQADIQPICVRQGVDILFAGHNHYYARCFVNGVTHLTTGGGGAPLKTPIEPPGDAQHPNIVAVDRSYNFSEIYIRDKVLRSRARDKNGIKVEVFTLLHPSTATHWYVKPDGSNSNSGTSWDQGFETISHAVSQAQNGDLIEVAEGTYSERIDFGGKSIVLTSTDPEDPGTVGNTVIYLSGSYVPMDGIVNFDSGEGLDSVLTGFTIKGDARGAQGAYTKNGVYCENSSPTISNCVITKTTLATYCKAAAPVIKNCTIYNNWQGAWYDKYQEVESAATIKNSLIYDNDWGVEVNNSPSVKVIGNTIEGNFNEGVWSNVTPGPTVTNCIIWDNDIDGTDELLNCSPAKVSYSCIMGGYTGGTEILDLPPDFVNIYDFWDMTSADGTDTTIIVENGSLYQIDDVIEYNDDGIVRTVTGISTNTITFDNSLASDSVEGARINNWGPSATDLLEDYHLQSSSPCIGAGDNSAVQAGDTDIDDGPRLQQERVDIGADETPYNAQLFVKVGGGSDGRTWETAMGSIQDAIDEASDGDIIDVNVGTYYEGINFKGKAITLRSTAPLNWSVVETTVIDGNYSETVVTFNSTETSASVLDGFTITNGDSTYGAGINVYNSSPTIRNCIIRENYAEQHGAGMYNNYGNPTLSRCIFRDNESDSDGAGIQNNNGNVTVTNCMFFQNEAGYNGGAIDNYDDMTITNCTFSDNSATSYGGAIYNDGDMTITNSILWGDLLDGEPDEIYDGNNTVVTYCDVEEGWSGTGNIDADPQFVYPYNYDYRLSSDSPCIDVGDPYGTYNGQVDVDGDERVFDITGKGDGIVDVDMGADEKKYDWYVKTDGDDYDDGKSWETAFATVSHAIYGASGNDIIGVDEGTYYENINYSGKAITIRSTAPLNWDVVEATVIDGSNSGTVVTFNYGETSASVLDGITIADGNSTYGGGINVYNSSPTIRNCIIRDNYAGQHGAGMYNNYGNPTLSRCIFRDNESYNDGAGIQNSGGGYVTVTNCMFLKNDAGYNGGAISNYHYMTITNCTFSGNEASSYGGAIYNGGSMSLTNSILWGDKLNGQPDEIGGSPYVYYCNVEGGFYGTGNIDADPLFVDPNNYDYHIGPNSPCIDVGDPTGDYAGEVDIDGEQRVIDITGKGNGIVDVDMGADEKTYYEVTYDWCVKPDGNDADDGKSWDTAFATISNAISEANDNDIIGVAVGTYYENINFSGKDITILSTDPLNWSVVEATVIDANDSGTAVTFNNAETSTSILDGFTITDGNIGTYGGGIYTYYASPTIHNCIIRDNYASQRGGGMYNDYGSPTLSRCIFRDNESFDGAGLNNCNGSVTLINCMLVQNDAGYNGGAITNYDNMNITNCTFSGNTATSYGAGIYNSDYIIMKNSILWGDKLNGQPDEIESYYGSVYASYCDIEGGWSGTGNINSNPLFEDPNDYDYHLDANSPCIDVGDPNGMYTSQVDIDGDERVIDIPGKGNGIVDVDMGTDEY
jgi:predicted outer membrane repeat protein